MNPLDWDAPWFVVFAALFVIVLSRAIGTYWVGRLLQRGVQRTRAAHLMNSPGYANAVARLNRWGAPVVSLSFLTIGFQTLVNLAAGASRMPLRRYLPAVSVGCVLWAAVYGTVGTIGFHGLALLGQRSPGLAIGLGLLLVAAATAFIVWRVREAKAGRIDAPGQDVARSPD